MHRYFALATLGSALALLGASPPRTAPAGQHQPSPDKVYVTAAHGEALVMVQVIVPRELVLCASGNGSWSGDTLTSRTPLALALRAVPARITFRALSVGDDVRVTLPPEEGRALLTRVGREVRLGFGPDGWSLNASP
jgi:hypothetical protein